MPHSAPDRPSQDTQAVTSAAIAKQVILPTYSRWDKESLGTTLADFLYVQKAWTTLKPLLTDTPAEGNWS